MANICANCGGSVFRTTFRGGKFIGIDCGCYTERTQASAINPYGDLTIAHVHGEDGKPIRVTSSRQLSAAEQRYNFASVVRNFDQSNIDRAPQQKVLTVGDVYKRKFSRGA